MSDFIRSRSCSIAELFADDYRFNLPYFQRGYAWQVEHALRLLSDIRKAADGDRKLPWYPLGSIIVAKQDKAPEALLTDGHQRLITLTILLSILRDSERDAALKMELSKRIFRDVTAEHADPRLVSQTKIQSCLHDYVQENGATEKADPADLEALTDSETNIIANRKALRGAVLAMTGTERQFLTRYLLHKCVVVVMEVGTEEIAQVLFTTMHDTGLRPTSADLFKAEVLGAIDEDSRDAAQSEWELIEASLGRGQLDVLLRQIVIIADRDSPRGPAEDRLTEVFNLTSSEGALHFVQQRLKPVGGHLADVVAAQIARNDRPAPLQRTLRFLSWVRNHDTWLAPVLHWLDVHGNGGGETRDFLVKLEALAWTQMIIAGDPEQRDRRYMKILRQIPDRSVLEKNGPLAVTAKEVAEVRNLLAAPNFTKRRYKQFFLLRIDASMRGEAEPLPLPNGTIEHVYPGRPADNSQWRSVFKGPQAAVLRQTLGNVTLLTTAEQDNAKNKDFAFKRPVYEGSTFVVTRQLATFDEWTPDTVQRRTRDLIDVALRGWELV